MMRPFNRGEDIESYLVEMTQELVAQRPTTKTFVAPALTTVERDALVGPAAGMIVFNTTTLNLDIHDGVAWRTVSI